VSSTKAFVIDAAIDEAGLHRVGDRLIEPLSHDAA